MAGTTQEMRSPDDAGLAIRARRKELKLTQQQLADRAGVSRKLVAEIEAGHPRAEFGKLLNIFSALGFTLAATPEARKPAHPAFAGANRNLNPRTRDYAEIFADLLRRKDYEWALRELSEYVTASLAEGRPLLTRKPSLPSPEWTAALAGATSLICHRLGKKSPAWTKTTRLPNPWFPADSYRPVTDQMKGLTMQETPAELADLNVFIRERSLVNS